MTTSGPALLAARFPRLGAALAPLTLADLPTPFIPAPALAAAAGAGQLWIKRDDQASPRYGGNKLRKLEYLLADARRRGCDTVVTFGATGSNHVLATAVFARQLGMRCVGVLTDQPSTPWLEATLRYHLLLGTTLVHSRSYDDGLYHLQRIREQHPGGPGRVCDIPWGGSSWRGATGFVAAALELAGQLQEAGQPAPDFLYLACGTMGTTVGLAIGLRVAGLPTRLVAARVVPPVVASKDGMAALFDATCAALHAADPAFPVLDEPLANVELREEFFGPGYAEPTPAGREAVAVFADKAGLRIETTYTGKAAAALLTDGRAGRLAGRSAVFWNTYNAAPYPAAIATVDLAKLPAGIRIS